MKMGDTGHQITRRTFLEGAAINAMGLAAAGVLMGMATTTLSGCAANTAATGGSSSAGTSTASPGTTSTSSDMATIDERYTADLTELFADRAAFDAEAARLENDAIPALATAASQVSDEASLIAYLELNDEVVAAVYQVMLYADMRFYVDSADQDAQAEYRVSERISQEADLARADVKAFLSSADDATWQTFLSSPDLALWHRSLMKVYSSRSHVLPLADEALLAGSNTAKSNVRALFTTLEGSDFYLESITDSSGAEVIANYSLYKTALESADRDYREHVFKTYYGSLEKPGDIFAGNFSTYVKLCEDLASAHGYASALEKAMGEYDINQEIFDTLIASTRANLDAYAAGNKLRAQTLGIDELMPWDRSVPLAAAPDTSFSYEDAQSLIIAALAPLGDDYTKKLKEIFAHRWIDASPRSGKASGAAMFGTVVGHPYIFMSFTGGFDSVDTLAHELGHFINFQYSIEASWSNAEKDSLPFTSEIASITNEILLQDYMADNATNDTEKLYYLSQQINLIEATFFRQVMLAVFEEQAHQSVIDGNSLSADALNTLFNDAFAEFYPGISTTEENGVGWSYIMHFYQDFYVQSYAIAIAGAYSVADGIESGRAGALDNYLEFLAAGQHLPADELYAMVGVDLSNGDYITPLIQKYRTLLDEAEKLL